MGYPMEAVFVFGSNLAGRHGAGAALHAAKAWGAQAGIGEGPTGNAYALPTKGHRLEVLELKEVKAGYQRFVKYAESRKGKELFLLTPFGTGLAGYPRGIIRGMVEQVGIPANVALTRTWLVK